MPGSFPANTTTSVCILTSLGMRCWCLCGRGRGTSRRPSVKRLPGHQTSSWSLRSNNRKMAIIIKKKSAALKSYFETKMCIYAKQEISSFTTRWQAVYTQNVAIARKSDVSYFILFFLCSHTFSPSVAVSVINGFPEMHPVFGNENEGERVRKGEKATFVSSVGNQKMLKTCTGSLCTLWSLRL